MTVENLVFSRYPAKRLAPPMTLLVCMMVVEMECYGECSLALVGCVGLTRASQERDKSLDDDNENDLRMTFVIPSSDKDQSCIIPGEL